MTADWLNCWTCLSQPQQRRLREHYTHILFPPEWSHTQDGHITEKKTGQLEWDYAVAFNHIYDTLTDEAYRDDSADDHLDTTSTTEDIRDRTSGRETEQRGSSMVPITEWARSPTRMEDKDDTTNPRCHHHCRPRGLRVSGS